MSKLGKRQNQAWLFLAPAIIVLGLFLFIPSIISFCYSFTDFNMLAPSSAAFVGITNYLKLFKDPIFMKSLKNIVQFVAFVLPIQVGTALGLALIVNKKRPFNMFYKVAFFAPVVVSLAVTSILWMYILNPSQGILNSLLAKVGISAQPFLNSPKQAMFAIIFLSAWQACGNQMIIFLAGLQNIPKSLYEAADLDGAGKWSTFKNITVPLLKPTTVLILTTTFIDAFKMMTQAMIMTQGGPLNSTMTPLYYIYRTGFTDRQLGYASAMSVVYGFGIILFTIVQRKVTHADDGSGQ